MKILELIENNDGMTNKDISKALGLTAGHVRRETKKLYNKGLVLRIVLKEKNAIKYFRLAKNHVSNNTINIINSENPWSTIKLLEYYKNNKIQLDLHA